MDEFIDQIRDLEYEDIQQLCNDNQLCDSEDIWLFLLERDFNPITKKHSNAINKNKLYPKDLYHNIYTTSVKRANKFFNKYGIMHY